MKRFAVVFTCTQGFIEQVASLCNGLERYGNDVDIHIVSENLDKEFIKALPEGYYVPDWNDIAEKDWSQANSVKRSGWQVRFYRYKHALTLTGYEAVMTVDADTFVCGNLMEHFAHVVKTGEIVMAYNPRSIGEVRMKQIETEYHKDGDTDLTRPVSTLEGAASPAFHSHMIFWSPTVHKHLFEQVYQWGLKEPYGDMATIARTLVREKAVDLVKVLPNAPYCFINPFEEKVLESEAEDGSPILTSEKTGEPFRLIHGRWWHGTFRRKQIAEFKATWARPVIVYNTPIILKTMRKLNEIGRIKWEPYASETEQAKWFRDWVYTGTESLLTDI